MDRFEAMTMFLTAIEKGSLSAAAREMRVPVPTLSRKVADLEAQLAGVPLHRFWGQPREPVRAWSLAPGHPLSSSFGRS